MVRNSYKKVAELPILQNVLAETVDALEEQGKIQSYKKGSIVYRASQPQNQVFILMEGIAFIYTLTNEGIRKIIFILGPGAILNESIFIPERCGIYCEMLKAGKVYQVEQKKVMELMEKDFTLVQALMVAQEYKLKRTCHQLKNTLGSIYQERKLAAKLWKLANDYGIPAADSSAVTIDLNLSVTFLADMMGTPRETTSRILRKLIDMNLISMEKKVITVRNMQCLSNFYKHVCGNTCDCDEKK